MKNSPRKSTERLVVEWIVKTRRRSFTAEEVQTDCRLYWKVRGLPRQGTTFWRAAQRVKSEGYLGKVREESCRANGASWLRFHYGLLDAERGLERLSGGLFGRETINHGNRERRAS